MKNHDYYRNRKEWHLDQLASIACQTNFAQFSFLITRDVTTSLRIRNEWDYLYIMNHDYYRIRNNWYKFTFQRRKIFPARQHHLDVKNTCVLFTKVINVGSDTFGNPIFQKGLQN